MKVSIITRAYNRLEYTSKCIDNLIKMNNYDNYEHIVINNNSNDGTKQWLNWISNLEYFKKVKAINLNKNFGDWGGMIKALEYVSPDSEYIVQLDNDVIINDPDWINKCIFILENIKEGIVQLKRTGVRQNVKIINRNDIEYDDGEKLIFGKIQRPVAAFMLRTSHFKNVKNKLPLDLGAGKTTLSNLLGGTVKLNNVSCHVLDGYTKERGFALNYRKYPHKNVHKGI